MSTFQRDLDAAAERARRFFADARDPDRRRRGDLANAALELSQVLISLALNDERPQASFDASPTILRFDAFRSPSKTVSVPSSPTRREPDPRPRVFVGDAESTSRAPTFPRLFVPRDERPRLRVVAD